MTYRSGPGCSAPLVVGFTLRLRRERDRSMSARQWTRVGQAGANDMSAAFQPRRRGIGAGTRSLQREVFDKRTEQNRITISEITDSKQNRHRNRLGERS